MKKGRSRGGGGGPRGRLKLVVKSCGLQLGKNWLTGLRDVAFAGSSAPTRTLSLMHLNFSHKRSTRQHNRSSAAQQHKTAGTNNQGICSKMRMLQ